MDRFVDRFLATSPDGDFNPRSLRDSVSIVVYSDTVEGPLIRVCLGTTSELEYLWDGSDHDASAIIDAAVAALTRSA
jgi:hypothetical protein